MANNRVVGVKKSQFTADTSVDDEATHDFVLNGENIKIKHSDFINTLGVTGSIGQVGDPTGVPVLDQQGSFNAIRNLEEGPGVQLSLSPDNGIIVSSDTTGEIGDLEVRVDALELDVAAIQAELDKSTETVMASLSDFPDPVSEVITIGIGVGLTKIRIEGNIDISPNTLAVAGFVQISGNNGAIPIGDVITSNATAPLINVGSGAMFMNRIGVNSTGGDLYSIDGGVIVSRQCFHDGVRIGVFNNLTIFICDFNRFTTSSDGIVLTGDSCNELIVDESNIVSVAGNFVEFGTAKIRNVDISSCAWIQKADNSNALLSGLGDDNIIPGGRISVENTRSVVENGEEDIIGITNANPGVVTVSGTTNRSDGDLVTIRNVTGMTEINNIPGSPSCQVVNSTGPGGNTYELLNIDTTSFGTYTGPSGIAEVEPFINLIGFSPSMSRGEFISNTGLPDSQNSADLLFDLNATTTINTINIPELMNGIFSSTISERVDVDSSGVITNRSRESIAYGYTVDATIEKVGGGADLIQVGVGLKRNGPIFFDSDFVFQGGGVSKGSQSADPTSVHCKLLGRLNPGDQLAPMLVNTGSTSNIITLDCYCSFVGD
jgi:hypothetical protein